MSKNNEENKKSKKTVIIAIISVIALLLTAAGIITVFFFANSEKTPEKLATPSEITQWISDNLYKEELTDDEITAITDITIEEAFLAQWKSAVFLSATKNSFDIDYVSDTMNAYTDLYKQLYPETDKINNFISYSKEFNEIKEKCNGIKKELGYMPYQTMLSQGDYYVYEKLSESSYDDTLKEVNTQLQEFSKTKQSFYLGAETGYDDNWEMCPTGERFVFISDASAFPEKTEYTLTYEYTGKTTQVKDEDGKTYTCNIMRVIENADTHSSKKQLVEEINNSFFNALAKMTTSMVRLKNNGSVDDLCTMYNLPFADDGSMDLGITNTNGMLSLRFSGKYYSATETKTEVMYPNNEDGSTWVTYDIAAKAVNTEIFFNTDGSVILATQFLKDDDVFPCIDGKYDIVPSGEPVNGYIADKLPETENNSSETVYVNGGSSYQTIDPYSMFGNRQVDFYSGSFYRVEVGGSVLNVRTGPGKGYSRQTQLADQTDVAVLGIYNGWAYVQYAFRGYQGFSNNTSTYSVEGWVSADYLEIIPYSP